LVGNSSSVRPVSDRKVRNGRKFERRGVEPGEERS
jgi:hypothetical protein